MKFCTTLAPRFPDMRWNPMSYQTNIPNTFPPPNNQGPQPKEPKPWWVKAQPQVLLRGALTVLAVFIVWTVIRELSGLGSTLGSTMIEWFDRASISPENEREFTNFLKLVLTAGFIALLLSLFKKNDGK